MRRLHQRLWAVPLAIIGLCLIAGLVAIAIDRANPHLVSTTFTGTPAGAQLVLTTIASSMITLVTLVLTVVTVAIELAMGQFSPRIVQAVLRDRANRLSFGLFGGTAAFTVLAAVQVDDERSFVPGLTVLLAYALTLASLVALVLYVDRAGRSLRVSGLIDLVGDSLHGQLASRFPDRLADVTPDDPALVAATEAGAVVAIEHDRLVEEAQRAGCVLELLPAMGDFVPAGAPLLRIHGDAGGVDRERLRRLIVASDERTHETDPAYGFRKLVDIATRSARDDPTTTVQAVHRLHDALRQLATAEIPDGRHFDAAGELRLVTREVTWDGYVHLAFDEVRLAGASQPQVGRRLQAALLDLKAIAPDSRHAVLDYELALLEGNVSHALEADDIATALVPDPQGIGSGADVSR